MVFTCTMLASTGISCHRVSVCPSVHPSVRLSVTIRSSTKTAKHRIMQTMPHENFGKTQPGSPPLESPNAVGVG